MKALGFFFVIASSMLCAAPRGILVVGTQEEVRSILAEQNVSVSFTVSSPSEMVAVRLTRGEVAIFEGERVHEIIELVGAVVEGCVVITLKAGSELWELLEHSAHTIIQVGHLALKAAVAILGEAKCIVIDGVTFVVQTSLDVLGFLVSLVKNVLP